MARGRILRVPRSAGQDHGSRVMLGLVAAMAQIVVSPGSAVPMVGASGAISGVMGGYLVLYPRVRIHMLVFLGFFVTTIAVPAAFMLLYWAAVQFLSSLWSLGAEGQGGGVEGVLTGPQRDACEDGPCLAVVRRRAYWYEAWARTSWTRPRSWPGNGVRPPAED